MHLTLNYFGNPLTTMEYSFFIKNTFIVPLNLLQKKVIFETFSGSHCREQNISDFTKDIFFLTPR